MELSFEQKEEIGLKYVRDLLEPASPYGVKYLKNEGFYGPAQQAALEEELENVALLLEALREDEAGLRDVQHSLSYLKDLSGSLENCAHQALTEVELFELSALCRRLAELKKLAEKLAVYSALHGVAFTSPEGALRVLDPEESGRQSFYVEDGRTPALEQVRAEKRRLETELRQAEDAEKERLQALRQEAARAEEEELKRIYEAMSLALRPHLPALKANVAAAGRLDAGIAKALLARRFDCVCPQIGDGPLCLEEAVHPQAAEAMAARDRAFVPISLRLDRGVTLLTGANMGGKSLALKTVLLNTALALSGCFVFAREAQIPLFARIELINRDFADTSRGLSSFGGEILRLKEALAHLEEGGLSLIVMDELARGTNAREGAAILKGTVAYLSGKNAMTLLATHYDGAGALAVRHYQVKGLQKMHQGDRSLGALSRDGLRQIEQAMDYGLMEVPPGTDCPQDAIAICRLLGLPEEILREGGTSHGE